MTNSKEEESFFGVTQSEARKQWTGLLEKWQKEQDRLKADKQRIEEALEFAEQGLQSLGIELALASISNKKIEYLCHNSETYRKALRSAMTSLHKDWGFKFK